MFSPNPDTIPLYPTLQFFLPNAATNDSYFTLTQNALLKIAGGLTVADPRLISSDPVLDSVWSLSEFSSYTSMSFYSQLIPKLTSEPYAYLISSAQTSIWNADGRKLNTMAVIPRNRPFAMQITPESSFAFGSTMIKTSLDSVRSMHLQLVDSHG